jgi:hypothetical protein
LSRDEEYYTHATELGADSMVAMGMQEVDDGPYPGDEYDWDRNDERQYCKHGTFIGSWWGPDLLCGQCETE